MNLVNQGACELFLNREPTYGWMVRRAVAHPTFLLETKYSSAGGDVFVDSKVLVVTSSILKPVGSVSSSQSLGGAHIRRVRVPSYG
jgi:hypothetical protein